MSFIGKHNTRNAEDELEALVSFDYSVVQFTEWHFRINGRLDIWPPRRKYYDNKSMRKGTYSTLKDLVKELGIPPLK